MCLHPNLIPNPNYGLAKYGINHIKDCSSQYIPVPCGHCIECVRTSQMAYIQRVLLESKHNHLFMVMLSYNNRFLPKYVAPDGKKFSYANTKHISDMMKRIRNDNVFGDRGLRYISISEFGGKKHRPHFHLLVILKRFASDDRLDVLNLTQKVWNTFLMYWSVNLGSKRVPEYHQLLTYKEVLTKSGWKRNYDVQYVESYKGACVYVTKYILKDSDYVKRLHSAIYLNYPEDAKKIWSVIKPKMCKSLGFGLNATLGKNHKIIPDESIIKELKSHVNRSKRSMDYPCFFADNSTMPLARYYKKRGDVLSLEDFYHWFYKNDSNDVSDGFHYTEVKHLSTRKNEEKNEKRTCCYVRSRPDVLDEF